ncbi:zinc-binding protein A33-like [Scyliorhinus canicula]|uniref:zinc-binding protein A33-like n=1 Tax=Scyliorhinus canicula TaxID=7830 RepID=UPI0018F2D1B4|nr:zinc-binding protein A33-like [Scyliorhinus canicula]
MEAAGLNGAGGPGAFSIQEEQQSTEQGDQSFEMEDELSCAVCHDLYNDPVLLDCDHSFCRSCITQYWEKADSTSCPVCRKENSSQDLRLIRILSNIVEAFLKSDKGDKIQQECSRHKEKLKLFCKTDNQPICLVCQSSKNHQNHELLPVDEAAEEFKEELQTSLKLIQEQEEEREDVKSDHEETLTHIQDQSVKTEKQIKAQFEKLHQFLREEERIELEDLKLEKEKKSQEMKERIEKITEEISSLSVTVQDIEQELSEQDNFKFLTKFPDLQKRLKRTLPEPQEVYPLINVGKYIGSLQYRVWKKMLTVINTAPVTFDPNTAHPDLVLSEDLSTVRNTEKQEELPDNPERFDRYAIVLGSEGFTSGKHSWEVDVGNKTKWDVGVAKESVNRKGKITALNPDNGFWRLALTEGNKYWAKNWFNLSVKPKKIRVCLDYEGGKVSFYNSNNKSHIYTFTGTFTEKLYPYFSPGNTDGGKNTKPLKICPRRVTIQEDKGFLSLHPNKDCFL